MFYCVTCTGRQGEEEEGWAGLGTRDPQPVCSSAAFGRCQGHGHSTQGDERASSSCPLPCQRSLSTRAASQPGSPRAHPWPQKESVPELGVLWASQRCSTGTMIDTATATTQALARFSRDKAPGAFGKPHPLVD